MPIISHSLIQGTPRFTTLRTEMDDPDVIQRMSARGGQEASNPPTAVKGEGAQQSFVLEPDFDTVSAGFALEPEFSVTKLPEEPTETEEESFDVEQGGTPAPFVLEPDFATSTLGPDPVSVQYFSNDPNSHPPPVAEPDSAWQDDDDEGGAKQGGVGCVDGCLRDRHMFLTIVYVCLWILFLCTVIFGARAGEDDGAFVGAVVCGFFWLIFYWLLLSEWCGASSTKKYLDNIKEDEGTMDYVRSLYKAEPVITLNIECYHMETK